MEKNTGYRHALQNPVSKQKMEDTLFKTGISYRFHTPEWDDIMIKKYGTTVPYKNNEIRDKGINTVLDRYGVRSPMQLDFVKEKSKQTCLKKYGVEYSFQSENNKTKSKQTLLERYGVEYAVQLHRKISKLNLSIGEYLDVDSYEFPLESKSYDLKIGNTLIEVDPTVTHNSDKSIYKNSKPLDKNYHLNKAKIAKKHGYRCLHIFDWDDVNKIKYLFDAKNKIYARKCDVVFIDKKSSRSFLNKYHLQNDCTFMRPRNSAIRKGNQN